VELGRALGLRVHASLPKPIDLSALTAMLTHMQSDLVHQDKTAEEAVRNRTSAAIH
jgi:hypothetical protein